METGNPQKAVAAIRLNSLVLNSNSTPKSFNIPARIPKLKLVTKRLAQLATKRARLFVAFDMILFECLRFKCTIYILRKHHLTLTRFAVYTFCLTFLPEANSFNLK